MNVRIYAKVSPKYVVRNSWQTLLALPIFVPRGCTNNADSHFSGSLGALGENVSVRVVFPSGDSYLRSGDYGGERRLI